jgi:hypothetical protein
LGGEEMPEEIDIIPLLSNAIDGFTYVDSDKDVVEHTCEKTGETTQIELIEIEYFKDGHAQDDKANFCEHCKTCFVYKP